MKAIIVLMISFLLFGCGGSYKVKASANSSEYYPKTAHVVNQGGKSGDMDANVQRARMTKGLTVSASESSYKNPPPDLLVKYTDGWQWDIAMYLSAVDITFYDKSGNILVTGSYENSFWHEWPNSSETVQKVVDEMFTHLGKIPLKNQTRP
jgi:hypothetical protein